jgi:hypothetical protein
MPGRELIEAFIFLGKELVGTVIGVGRRFEEGGRRRIPGASRSNQNGRQDGRILLTSTLYSPVD